MAFLPELSERDAGPAARGIYGEMKRLGGVPMVALIFRHLATIPGGLEWTWGAIGPAWRQGRLQETAWRIARDARLDPLAPIPGEVLAALDVGDDAMREIRVVFEAYNRANPENLLSVLCMLRMLRGTRGATKLEERDWKPPAAPGPLVPMVDVTTMPREIADLLALVSEPGEAGGARIVPSLFRHFGNRRAFLALVVAILLPRLRDGSIDASASAIHAKMNAAAEDLVRSLSARPAPDPRIGAALGKFGGVLIPRMIVAGALLEGALPGSMTGNPAR